MIFMILLNLIISHDPVVLKSNRFDCVVLALSIGLPVGCQTKNCSRGGGGEGGCV